MRWYFDYISPYAYLQSTRLREFSDHESVECIPVLFAGLLDHWGNVGPAEITPKRDWTFRNAVWLAQRDDIKLTMPEYHPFNPLPLLRLGISLGNEIEVVKRLFRFVWVEGHVPANAAEFSSLLEELNTTAEDINASRVKSALIDNGKNSLQQNVFGVPTIERNGELFWGYEATDMALAHLQHTSNGVGSPAKKWPAAALTAATNLAEGPGRKIKPTDQSASESEKNRNKSAGSSSSISQSSVCKEPRIRLKPIDLKEPADLINAIRKRRGGELIELDRLLLYSTPLATGWNHFIGNVRTEFSVSYKLRELAMCTVAVVNKADYEFAHHAPIYIAAGGSEDKTTALIDIDTANTKTTLYDADELLTIKLATQMTRDIQVEDQLFKACQQQFSELELVELVATIAAYNMVSRFLVAFNVVP